ncbi:MAG: type II toxin-antitoxin system HigB family toxin [Saprospiraceae bacterium]|nr:type II toxin-antitoxin system HigB family toxin [Saprospiraceae bacterium]
MIGNDRVIFNIKGNDFRLIVSTNFKTNGRLYYLVRASTVYDLFDAKTIQFDAKILTYKTK